MTFTGRIRIYLILIALVPPLLIMSVIYFRSVRQLESADQNTAAGALERSSRFMDAFGREFEDRVIDLGQSEFIKKAAVMIKSNRASRADITTGMTGFDFLEMIDSNGVVLASAHRPGLLGRPVHENNRIDSGLAETVEYDISGVHAALAYILPIDKNILMYTGRYLDEEFRNLAGGLMPGEVRLYFEDEEMPAVMGFGSMDKGRLYEKDGAYYFLMAGGGNSGFFLVHTLKFGGERPLVSSLLTATGLVALGAVVIAILLGMYITGRAKREIDNLITATARAARGDFTTPVMAYEEGEFSELADSISTMMANLKNLRRELAVTEKIAAWKTMGQKVAHEIKNPLTPIEISVDDLRRSYHEKLPDFDRTLEETTATIKNEIHRLIKLLNEFVDFARMSAPAIKDVRVNKLIESLEKLYQHDIESRRLTIHNEVGNKACRFDPEAIRQVLVNLIKNGLESGPETNVTVTITDNGEGIVFRVEDSGPGFGDKILAQNFQPYVSTKKDGSGLGLVICQRIVHDHGGRIEIYSRAEGGAGVLIELPRNDG